MTTTSAPTVAERVLCAHPECGLPIEAIPPTFPGGDPFWVHVEAPEGLSHRGSPDAPEKAPERIECPGQGCRGPAWRMSDGNAYCERTRSLVPPDPDDVPVMPRVFLEEPERLLHLLHAYAGEWSSQVLPDDLLYIVERAAGDAR